MKLAALLLFTIALVAQQGPSNERPGNFDIRFEPAAVLQTGVQIPFKISVKDSLGKPLTQAKVTLQIETTDGTHTKVFPAPATDSGVYIAKPIFPIAGAWNVYVEVRRMNEQVEEMTARTIQFNVPE